MCVASVFLMAYMVYEFIFVNEGQPWDVTMFSEIAYQAGRADGCERLPGALHRQPALEAGLE